MASESFSRSVSGPPLSMGHLMAYAERETVASLIDRMTAFESVHGIVIGVDPLWVILARVAQTFPNGAWTLVDRLLSQSVWRGRILGMPLALLASVFSRALGWRFRPIELNWTCMTWSQRV